MDFKLSSVTWRWRHSSYFQKDFPAKFLMMSIILKCKKFRENIIPLAFLFFYISHYSYLNLAIYKYLRSTATRDSYEQKPTTNWMKNLYHCMRFHFTVIWFECMNGKILREIKPDFSFQAVTRTDQSFLGIRINFKSI